MVTMPRLLFAILILALVCLDGLAQDKSAPDKNTPDKKVENKKAKATPFANVFTFPKTITLAEDQQKKLDDLKTDYTPKLVEMKKALDVVMTSDRKKALKEAVAKAKADGKKGKELKQAGLDALQLNEDEKKQLAAANLAQKKLMAEINQKKTALLTDEQKKALKPKPKKTQ
jgi:hypothetical protein